MYLLNEQINKMIANEESQSICNVMVDDVRKAFCKFNKDKNDGKKETNSNHFIHAPLRLVTMFAILFKSMLVHGYSPETSVIISIPKNPHGNLNSSDNYKGIALGSALCKVIDYWILSKYVCYTLQIYNLVKEIINYYIHHKSNVFSCLLDASKAYDRVHFGKLFKILIKRKLPGIIVRFLVNNYTNQTLCTEWCGNYSEKFTPLNGVKQGSILSTALFNLYLDELLIR